MNQSSSSIATQVGLQRLSRGLALNYKLNRMLILKSFSKINDGHITLIESDEKHAFGDPQAELQVSISVKNNDFFSAVIFRGSLGAAEAYIRGDWECDDLTKLFRIFVKNQSELSDLERTLAWVSRMRDRFFDRFTKNTITGSKRNILAHYDLSNDFYKLWLDPTMTYSAGVFTHPKATMEEASIEKLDRMCRILDLQSTDHLLEIGTGWGSLAIHAARVYGCKITTTTISDQQYSLALERIKAAGLEDRVTVIQEDYRKLSGQYDKIISIEMIEAVGHRFMPDYVSAINRLLKPGGKVALQGITINDQIYEPYRKSVDFIKKYIFPGGNLVSVSYLMETVSSFSSLRPIHLSEIGLHYATTLQCWRDAFEKVLPEVRELGFSDEFIRLWRYYFTYCEAGFLEKHIGNVQLGFEKR
ncbi:MAG: class I SAM-dependent methyltransferase [Candidatus Marinimicrobia bacterium]|nr:class I SAM-dependent methyltransferase [Candidatus Neomarinimicrobiota bacterium]